MQEKFDKLKDSPHIPYHGLRREQRDLEWTLQTTVMKMDEERHLVERIAELQKQLKPAEERENVLRRLYRLDKSRTTQGSGLGLSLVAAIADLHNAKLELSDNEPGLCVSSHFPQSLISNRA